MWMILPSLSRYNLHFRFCCVLLLLLLLLFHSLGVFTPVLDGALSLCSEWRQVFSGLLSILADFNNTMVWLVFLLFPGLPVFFQSFSDCSKSVNCNWYQHHPHVWQLFYFQARTNIYWFSQLGQQNILIASLQRNKTSPTSFLWPSQLGLQNTLTVSLQRSKTPRTSVLHTTLNNLVRLQQYWSLRKSGVPLHCHHSRDL